MMDYLRRACEPYAKRTASTFKALLVTGARQVGKSTLLAHLFPSYPVVRLDDLLLREQAMSEPRLFLQNNPAPVTIDEVQYAPELFPYLKMACDESDEYGRYLLTGSQPLRLMERAAETLAGRVGIFELCGLSLREIQGCEFSGHFVPSTTYFNNRRAAARPVENIWKVIHRGSYPRLQDPSVDWQTFYGSYLQTYVERDVALVVNVRDQATFGRFMQAMAARTGQLLVYENVADELGISAKTVRSWISVLCASGIGLLLQPYSNSALTRAIKTPKFYLRDTGLSCYLTGWTSPKTAAQGAMAGALFETFVVNEIVKSFASEGRDWRLYLTYYRGKDRLTSEGRSRESEIDLVISEDGVLHPIEIKLSANPKPDMARAFSVLDLAANAHRGLGAIISLYPDAMYLTEDVFLCPPWWL